MPRDPSPKRLPQKRTPKNNPNQQTLAFGPEQMTLNLGYNMNSPQPAAPSAGVQQSPTAVSPFNKASVTEPLPFGSANPYASTSLVVMGERSPAVIKPDAVFSAGTSPAVPKNEHFLGTPREIPRNDEFTPQLDNPNKPTPGSPPAVPPRGGVPAVPNPISAQSSSLPPLLLTNRRLLSTGSS